MQDDSLYVLPLEPRVIERHWGSDEPSPFLEVSERNVGEIQLAVDGPSGVSKVTSGPWAGMTLSRLRHLQGRRVFGGLPEDGREWPLPVEIRILRSGPVSPAWRLAEDSFGLVLEAAEDSYLGLGLTEGRKLSEALALAEKNPAAWSGLIAAREVEAGDCFFMPRGSVGMLGPNVTLLEISTPKLVPHQELHDWGRRRLGPAPDEPTPSFESDLPGAPSFPEPRRLEAGLTELFAGPRFRVERIQSVNLSGLPSPDEVTLLVPVDGQARVRAQGALPLTRIRPGQAFLLPASLGRYCVESGGSPTLLRVTASYRSES